MIVRVQSGPLSARNRIAARLSLAAAVVLFAAQAVLAQAEPPAEGPPPAAAAPPAAAPAHQPGFLAAVDDWLKEQVARAQTDLERAQKSIGSIAPPVPSPKEAAAVLQRLPTGNVAQGREKCLVAANGAPDCRSAAESLCREKGFKGGQSVDIQSARKCPAHVWLSGRAPNDSECPTESFVTRAVCQ